MGITKWALASKKQKNKQHTLYVYIPLSLFGLIISYFTRALCNLVSDISDDNSYITCWCRSSQMHVNCMSTDTTFIYICCINKFSEVDNISSFLFYVFVKEYIDVKTILER